MDISAWSIRNPVAAVMLFVLLSVTGLATFQAMKVQNLPDMDLLTINVTAILSSMIPKQWQCTAFLNGWRFGAD